MARWRNKRSRRFGGCAGKARFGTFDEARASEPTQTAYLCDRCGCWHLTSKPVSVLENA